MTSRRPRRTWKPCGSGRRSQKYTQAASRKTTSPASDTQAGGTGHADASATVARLVTSSEVVVAGDGLAAADDQPLQRLDHDRRGDRDGEPRQGVRLGVGRGDEVRNGDSAKAPGSSTVTTGRPRRGAGTCRGR